MNIYFKTFGCKVNQYETAALARLFSERGYTVCESPGNADICVINTCSVTAESDGKAAREVRKLRRLLPRGMIAVTGCLPQACENVSELLPEADIICGTKERSKLPDLIEDFIENGNRTVYIPAYGKSDPYEELSCSFIPGHTRAFLKIQDGCDRFCSYCIIPYSRGRVRSRSPDDLKKDAAALAASGYPEIVLTGINLAFYGKGAGYDLCDAVKICAETDGIERIRLSSLEPEMLTNELLEKLSRTEKLCPSFHISLQSGCGKILKAMNRRYSPDDFYGLSCSLRKLFPDCSLTTDVMTGFPGETEEDHLESLEFVKKIGFSRMHVFPYSVRPGTKAASMPGQVPAEIKRRRAAEMSAVGEYMRDEFLKTRIGRTFPVLFEREKGDGYHRGYTPDYTCVKILTKNSEKSLRRSIFYVTIDRIEDGCCIGTIGENQSSAESFRNSEF